MSKSVRIPDRSYEQADELRQHGYESLTNVLAVAIDRLYQAERPKERTMFHIYSPWEMKDCGQSDWDDIFDLAAENNAQVWKHPDGSVAIATYDAMADYCESKGIDGDDWTEIKHERQY